MKINILYIFKFGEIIKKYLVDIIILVGKEYRDR